MMLFFTVAWGAFLCPLAYLYTSSEMVLTVGIISDLIRGDVFQWGKIMAGSLMGALPLPDAAGAAVLAGDGEVAAVGETERGGDRGDLVLALHEDAAVFR